METLKQTIIRKCKNYPVAVLNGGQGVTITGVNEKTGWISVRRGFSDGAESIVRLEDLNS